MSPEKIENPAAEIEPDINQSQIDALVNELSDEKMPLKVRKIMLLEEVGLPTPKAEIFMRDGFDDIARYVEERAKSPDGSPLIIRFGYIPERYSMPTYYVDNPEDIGTTLNRVSAALQEERDVAAVIVQDATPANQATKKISGRMFYQDDFQTGDEIVLELYKGSRSTGILNKVNADDPALVRFVKPYGGFLRPEAGVAGAGILATEDVTEILWRLDKQYKEKIDIARKVFLRLVHKTHPVVSLEFWYRDGKMFFTDLD